MTMEYCKKCDNLIIPIKTGPGKIEFICKICNSKKKINPKTMKIKQKIENDPLDTIPILETNKAVKPIMKKNCEECDGKTAYWWMMQTRSTDEPETRFYECTECGNTWREYS